MRVTRALAVACVANGAWVDPPGWRDAPNRDRAAEFLARLRHDAYDDYVTELGWPNATTRQGHRVRGWTNIGGIRGALEPLVQGELGSAEITVIEVGAWIGGSANAIADRLKQAPALQKAKLRVVSVDTWLGAPEFWGECCINAPDRGGGLRRVRGYPTVFHTFTRNLWLRGHGDVSSPLPLSGLEAATVLRDWDVRADAIYVDAAHDTEAAYRDMVTYWPLLRPGGVMFGDDAANARVFQAIVNFQSSFASQIKRRYDTSGPLRPRKSVWTLQKSDAVPAWPLSKPPPRRKAGGKLSKLGAGRIR